MPGGGRAILSEDGDEKYQDEGGQYYQKMATKSTRRREGNIIRRWRRKVPGGGRAILSEDGDEKYQEEGGQ